MKYTLEELRRLHILHVDINYIFFWGHQPAKDGEINKSCLSQWWPCLFEVNNIKYHNAEQYMMAEKARLFGDDRIRDLILRSKDPGQIKSLGRRVKGFQEDIWAENCFEIVKKANYEKFKQNEALKYYLIQTNNRILVEASPFDKIWGIGLSVTDERILNPLYWEGKNLLGFALMEVREELCGGDCPRTRKSIS